MASRNSANHAQNVAKYMSKQKQYLIFVNPEKDADIIEWFDKQKNKNGAVRKLIRKAIKGRANQIASTTKLRQKRLAEHLCIYCGRKDDRTENGKSVCQVCADRAAARRKSK